MRHQLPMRSATSMTSRTQTRSSRRTLAQAWPEVYLLLVLSLLLPLLALAACGGGGGGGTTSTPQTTMSACATSGTSRCYASGYWTFSSFNSFSANISLATLTCSSTCDGQNKGYFIDDEIWVTQTSRDPKSTGAASGYWVEAGYGTWTNSGSTASYYFWADNRPPFSNSSPGSFVAHMLGSAGSVMVTYSITRDSANNEYDVSIKDTSGGATVNYSPNPTTKNMISTSNPMVPQEVDAGLEFYGDNTYVSAGKATFDSFSIGTPNGFFIQSPADMTQTGATSGNTQCGC
jgi:hypothetical protein